MEINDLLFNMPTNLAPIRTEAKFSAWFWKKLKNRWGFYHKISDESRGMKPCDAIFALWWLSWLIEFKVTDRKSYKPYYLLRGSSAKLPGFQVKWLSLNSKNGWFSLVCIYNRGYGTYTLIDFRALLLDNELVIWKKGISCKTSGVVS